MPNEEQRKDQQDVGHLVQVRMDKLKALQEEGRDPFQIVK